MDEEYRSYRRQEVQRHSLYLLSILYIAFVILIYFNLNQRLEDEVWLYQFVLLIQGTVTLTMTIGHVVSRQKLYVVDILGLFLMISFSTSIFAAKKTGIFEDLEDAEHLDCNSLCIAFLIIYYVIYLGLFNARYLENLLIRQVFFIFTMVLLLL